MKKCEISRAGNSRQEIFHSLPKNEINRMQKGLKLELWPRESFVHDTNLSVGPVSSTEFSLGHNVSSKEAVDAVCKKRKKPERPL